MTHQGKAQRNGWDDNDSQPSPATGLPSPRATSPRPPGQDVTERPSGARLRTPQQHPRLPTTRGTALTKLTDDCLLGHFRGHSQPASELSEPLGPLEKLPSGQSSSWDSPPLSLLLTTHLAPSLSTYDLSSPPLPTTHTHTQLNVLGVCHHRPC